VIAPAESKYDERCPGRRKDEQLKLF
jgi:hypothetical protein